MNKIQAALLLIALIQTSCQKPNENLTTSAAIVITDTITTITNNSAISGGVITPNGNIILRKGVCWSTNHTPTIVLTTKTSDTSSSNNFISYITGLIDNTIYYVRAYATTANATVYGSELSFNTTSGALPVFSDKTLYFYGGMPHIFYNNYVTSGSGYFLTDTSLIVISVGSIKSSGGSSLKGRGVVWSTNHNPTISLSTKIDIGNSLSWINNVNITGLNSPKTTYYLREYATNNYGTVYGPEDSIRTSATQQTVAVGDYFKGGLVYYILQQGDIGYDPTLKHGLIAGVDDISWGYATGYYWDNNKTITTNASDTIVGRGKANTSLIVNAQGSGTYAASHCINLTLNGYHDWYLPSRDELKLLYTGIGKGATGANKDIARLATHGTVTYWSSSEVTNLWAYYVGFSDGTISYSGGKMNAYLVCPVRSF